MSLKTAVTLMILVAFYLLESAAASTTAGTTRTGTITRLGECSARMAESTTRSFSGKNSHMMSLNIIVTRFSGPDADAEDLGFALAENLASSLDTYSHSDGLRRRLGEIAIIREIKVKYVPCVITNGHEQAREMGRAWGADLVFWGQASCSKAHKDDCHLTPLRLNGGSLENSGNITTGSNSPVTQKVYIDARIHDQSKAAFKTSLTVVRWHRLETAQNESTSISLDPKQIQDLNFPRIAANEPILLFRFMIGVYAFLSSRYVLASDMFFDAQQAVFAKAIDLEPLYEVIGISHIYARREKLGLEMLAKSLQSCYEVLHSRASLCQIRSLSNLGWAYAKRRDYKKAIDYYSNAIALHRELAQEDSSVNNQSKAILLNNAGYALLGIGDSTSALDAFLEARKYASGNIDSSILGNIGYIYMKQGNLDRAEDYLTRALAQHDDALPSGDQVPQAGFCSAADVRTPIYTASDPYGTKRLVRHLFNNIADAAGKLPMYINLADVMMQRRRQWLWEDSYFVIRELLNSALEIAMSMGDLRAECDVREKVETLAVRYEKGRKNHSSHAAVVTESKVETNLRENWSKKSEAINREIIATRCKLHRKTQAPIVGLQ